MDGPTEEDNEVPDASFDDAWNALAGTGPKRICADARLYIDASDGRPVHEHLRELTEALEARGVIVSALDALPDGAHGATMNDWHWDEGSGGSGAVMQVAVTTTSPAQLPMPLADSPVEPETRARMLPVPPSGIVPAFMLSPDYERVLMRTLSTDATGQARLDDELGFVLAMQIRRRVNAGTSASVLIAGQHPRYGDWQADSTR